MKFADLDEARAASGVRLVVVAGVPSAWSEAAKGLLIVKGIDALLVRHNPTNPAFREWTGAHNAPALMIDGEPPRTHWSDILEAAERLGGRLSLVPQDPEQKARMIGLAHALLGENGLLYEARLMVIHRGLETEGKEGFSLRTGKYLAPKYGYSAERAIAAKPRVLAGLSRFAELLGESEYVFGANLTALDIYLAASMALFRMLPEDQCRGVHPSIRKAFDTHDAELAAAVTPALVSHRQRIYERHIGLPIDV